MKRSICLAVITMAALTGTIARAGASPGGPAADDTNTIRIIDPPEQGFFSKELSFHGILIKSHLVVSNEALIAARDRIARETEHLPMVISNLAAAGAELHIIGRNQVTTDLPEWQQDKHVPLYEPTYNGQTRDRRTRGMGGLITSCGEENVLNLPNDHYRGSDICMHEFAHNIEGAGIPRSLRTRFDEQYRISKEKGRWLGTVYAGSNPSEYFAELTMWYFGSHGSLGGLQGEKPGPGPEGLKKYDPEAFALFDEFYSGRIPIEKLEPRGRPGERVAPRVPPGGDGGGNVSTNRGPRISRSPAGRMVARLTSYQVGETKLTDFFGDAGMTGPEDKGTNGWAVTRRDVPAVTEGKTAAADGTALNFRVSFHYQDYRDASVADLDFKAGVLSAFKWNN